MDTVENISNREPVVRGVGNFPAYFLLAAFLVMIAGFYAGSVIASVIGVVMLMISVIGIERLSDGKTAHAHQKWHNPNSVIIRT